MTQPSLSDRYAEIEAKLGRPLSQFVADRRADGASWRGLAAEILQKTGIKVSYEALRVWHQGIPARAS